MDIPIKIKKQWALTIFVDDKGRYTGYSVCEDFEKDIEIGVG